MSPKEYTSEILLRSNADQLGSSSSVCVRGGAAAADKTETQVSLSKSTVHRHKKNKDRRGTRWMRGRLSLEFGHVGEVRLEEPESGEIKLQSGSHHSDSISSHRRGRQRSSFQIRNEKPLRGIPFNYHYRLNRLFSSLCIPKHRPFEDLKLQAVTTRDNGNQIPLSVVGISSALVDGGCSQRDFVVAAKVIVNGDDIFVDPSSSQEQSIDLTRVEPGQGVLMMEYFALSNRVAYVFAKGQLTSSQLKKALAVGVSSCQSAATSAVELLRRKYDDTMELGLPNTQSESAQSVPKVRKPTPEIASLKSSFKAMLTTPTTGASKKETLPVSSVANAGSSVPVTTVPAPSVSAGPGKKLSLADLAKGKKSKS